jgi:3-hydroxybutyryl-CoA dehydrogenase
MGAGIAQACLAAGHEVSLHDAREEAVTSARAVIGEGLARAAAKDRLAGRDPDELLGALRLEGGTAGSAAAEADVVIEAVAEDAGVKARVWSEIGAAAPEGALLTSNTSSLSITALAAASARPERFCGLHFFNPVAVLPLVEVVRGEATPRGVLEEAEAFARGLGKTPIRCLDRPGFLVNRLLIPYLNEAANLAEEGVAEPEAIDQAMQLGANMPIGPLALADLVGLDVVLAVMESLHEEFGDPRYRPAPALRRRVRAGRLGRKTGRGFHEYGGEA